MSRSNIGTRTIGNVVASGTEIIQRLGAEHVRLDDGRIEFDDGGRRSFARMAIVPILERGEGSQDDAAGGRLVGHVGVVLQASAVIAELLVLVEHFLNGFPGDARTVSPHQAEHGGRPANARPVFTAIST